MIIFIYMVCTVICFGLPEAEKFSAPVAGVNVTTSKEKVKDFTQFLPVKSIRYFHMDFFFFFFCILTIMLEYIARFP